MKKYPKNLADAIILAETVQNLYEKADSYETQAEDYKNRIKEGEKDQWLEEYLAETEAKMAAYIRLAEKLTK